VFTRDLARKIIAQNFKVICVDFTNEYSAKFADLKPSKIIADDKQAEMFAAIEDLATEIDKFPNQRNRQLMGQKEAILKDRFLEGISEFLKSDVSVALFELPDVSNTTGILEYTKWFFRMLFQIAKTEGNYGQRVCIVLEEAHTVIPEWNFIGVEEKKAQSLVNSIGQIALQGRKYGIGFVVIAQRTANVSKTVLTQCNSIIAFQQFDKTSGDFLTNYMGTEMVIALPSLRFRQAVAVGKGFKTGAPVIFEVPEIKESPGT
jgi:Predicted ATPase